MRRRSCQISAGRRTCHGLLRCWKDIKYYTGVYYVFRTGLQLNGVDWSPGEHGAFSKVFSTAKPVPIRCRLHYPSPTDEHIDICTIMEWVMPRPLPSLPSHHLKTQSSFYGLKKKKKRVNVFFIDILSRLQAFRMTVMEHDGLLLLLHICLKVRGFEILFCSSRLSSMMVSFLSGHSSPLCVSPRRTAGYFSTPFFPPTLLETVSKTLEPASLAPTTVSLSHRERIFSHSNVCVNIRWSSWPVSAWFSALCSWQVENPWCGC